MSSNPPSLTPEEQSLGAIYFWLHQRAELLRQQKTVTNGEAREDDPKATADTNQPLIRANRPGNRTTRRAAGQKVEVTQ